MHCTFCLHEVIYSLHSFIPILLDSLFSLSCPEFSDSDSVVLHPSQGSGDKAERGAYFDGRGQKGNAPAEKSIILPES